MEDANWYTQKDLAHAVGEAQSNVCRHAREGLIPSPSRTFGRIQFYDSDTFGRIVQYYAARHAAFRPLRLDDKGVPTPARGADAPA